MYVLLPFPSYPSRRKTTARGTKLDSRRSFTPFQRPATCCSLRRFSSSLLGVPRSGHRYALPAVPCSDTYLRIGQSVIHNANARSRFLPGSRWETEGKNREPGRNEGRYNQRHVQHPVGIKPDLVNVLPLPAKPGCVSIPNSIKYHVEPLVTPTFLPRSTRSSLPLRFLQIDKVARTDRKLGIRGSRRIDPIQRFFEREKNKKYSRGCPRTETGFV